MEPQSIGMQTSETKSSLARLHFVLPSPIFVGWCRNTFQPPTRCHDGGAAYTLVSDDLALGVYRAAESKGFATTLRQDIFEVPQVFSDCGERGSALQNVQGLLLPVVQI